MPTPISHIVYSNKVFNKFFSQLNKKDFFIGTSFPDIRYLKVIDRSKTHYQNLKVTDLKDETAFMTGLKFHSIIDETREKFIVERGIYQLCPQSPFITQALKIFEDQLLHHHIKDWSEYTHYLDEVIPEERNFSIPEPSLKQWHAIVQNYIKKTPDQNSIEQITLSLGFEQKITKEIIQSIKEISSQQVIIDTINELYSKIDHLLE